MVPNHGETPAHDASDPRNLVTAAEAERLGIAPASTVRWWAQRGYIAPIGIDGRTGTQGGGHPSPLYRRDILERMAARSRRWQRTHPEPMDAVVVKLHATTDAQVWAREWCRIARDVRDRGDEIINEGWMIGWFANAIEVGRSAGMSSSRG